MVNPKRNPLIYTPPLSTHAAPSQTHTHLTCSTNSSHPTTLIHSTLAALDTIPEPRVPHTCSALTTTTPQQSPIPALSSSSHPHILSAYTHATQTTVHASQSQQPPHPHRVPRQPHIETKDDHMTTDTPQGHRPSSRSEINLIILQVYINGIKNKLEELKLLIYDTHVDIITIQETKLTPKENTRKIHNFTTVRANRLHKAGGGLITLIRDDIIFITTDIHSTINTHNTELQIVKVHIKNTKHIRIANIYIPPRGTTSTHNKTADTDLSFVVISVRVPGSIVYKGHVISEVISNTTLQQTSSPDITTVSYTLYNRTSWNSTRNIIRLLTHHYHN